MLHKNLFRSLYFMPAWNSIIQIQAAARCYHSISLCRQRKKITAAWPLILDDYLFSSTLNGFSHSKPEAVLIFFFWLLSNQTPAAIKLTKFFPTQGFSLWICSFLARSLHRSGSKAGTQASNRNSYSVMTTF